MNSKNHFSLLIIFIICCLPLPFFVSNIFYFILIIYSLFYAVKNRIKPNFSTYFFVFFAFYLLMILSYLWTIDKELTVAGIVQKSAFLLLPIVFSIIPKFNYQETNKIFRYFSFSTSFFALFFIGNGVLHFYNSGSSENLFNHQLVSPLNLNRIYVSLFTVVAIFHLVYNESNSLVNKLLLILLSIFLLLLSSKTIIITTILIFLILGHKEILSITVKNKIFFSSLFLVMAIFYTKHNPKFYTELIPKKFKEVFEKEDFQNNYYFNGSELRMLYTRFLYEFEKEEDILFTGFGLNATQKKIQEKCLQYKIPKSYGIEFNFHNQYNQILAEIGVFGLMLLISILFLGFKEFIKQNDKFSIAILIVFTALFITESLLNRQRGIYFFIIIYLVLFNSKRFLINAKK